METAVNLAKYRMNSWKEIEVYLNHSGSDSFKAYLNLIYGALMSMNPRDEIDVLKEVAPENIAKFVIICCLFISEGNTDYIFSNNYTAIKRLPEKPEIKIAEYLRLLALKKNKNRHELDKAKETNHIEA